MTLAIVDEARPVTGGVDTHADAHVAAALDGIGGLLGVQEFAATPAGYSRLLGWLQGFGTVGLAGIEGTGSYAAGLARHVAAAGIWVAGVDRSDRQDRRRQGKSDPLDAVSAARAALPGRASGAPRGRDGQVEAIRALMVAKRTARAQRTQTICQARALIITGPDGIRTRFTGQTPAGLVAQLTALIPDGEVTPILRRETTHRSPACFRHGHGPGTGRKVSGGPSAAGGRAVLRHGRPQERVPGGGGAHRPRPILHRYPRGGGRRA
jgi:transposase